MICSDTLMIIFFHTVKSNRLGPNYSNKEVAIDIHGTEKEKPLSKRILPSWSGYFDCKENHNGYTGTSIKWCHVNLEKQLIFYNGAGYCGSCSLWTITMIGQCCSGSMVVLLSVDAVVVLVGGRLELVDVIIVVMEES